MTRSTRKSRRPRHPVFVACGSSEYGACQDKRRAAILSERRENMARYLVDMLHPVQQDVVPPMVFVDPDSEAGCPLVVNFCLP